MRFSAVFKAVQFTGIFWNQKFLIYGRPWRGYGHSLGMGVKLREIAWRYSDGACPGGLSNHRPQPLNLVQELGFFLLEHSTPFLSIVEPWSWALLHKVQAKAFAGFRLQSSLPAHGQRTRSNHRTARRQKDLAAQLLQSDYGVLTSGYVAGRGGLFAKKKPGSKAKSAAKGPKGKKKPAVRTVKKPNVWR